MCGRYTLIGPARLREAYPEYDFEEFAEYRLPRFNVAPTQDVIGVLNDGTARARMLHWGISQRINARAETVMRDAVPWRCVLFADGFYEWRGGKPHRFTVDGEAIFTFAAICSPQRDCAIVTVPANALVASVHFRMPAILDAAARERWLAPGTLAADEAAALLQPLDPARMRVQTASMRLNDARRDTPDVIVDDDPVQQQLF